MHSNELSRRQLLVRSAIAAAGLSVATGTRAHAQAEPPVGPPAAADNVILNQLLGITFDAVATYARGISIFSADAATAVAARMALTKLAVAFQDHHELHAGALKRHIEAKLGTAVTRQDTSALPGSFPLAPKTADFVRLAADKEKLAAVAFAEAIDRLGQTESARLVAAISAVQAQHFAVLYLLAEGLLQTNDSTGANAELVVPIVFAVDVGAGPGAQLATNTQLDQLLALDAPT